MNKPASKKQLVLFIIGLVFLITGISILGFFGVRKLYRIHLKNELLKTHTVLEIPDLNIKAPILEGTDNAVLKKGVGHFPDTGDLGKGNYCIAGHSSPIYVEYFNNLKDAREGMALTLRDVNGNKYSYTIQETCIVETNELWILDDFNDTRVTLVTCTDDGSQRRIVIAKAP